MIYNVLRGTLNLAQSINQSQRSCRRFNSRMQRCNNFVQVSLYDEQNKINTALFCVDQYYYNIYAHLVTVASPGFVAMKGKAGN